MQPPMIIPARELTEEELAGFRIACGCFEAFGIQIEHSAITLPGVRMIPETQVQRLAGRAIRDGARKMLLSLAPPSSPPRLGA